MRQIESVPAALRDRRSNGFLLLIVLLALTILVIGRIVLSAVLGGATSATLLTDPFLQWPTADSVQVVWFTEFEGRDHQVRFGDRFEQTASATTIKLSRMYEDGRSKVGAQTQENQLYQKPVSRSIWRHQATVSGISGRIPYRVTSVENGSRISSKVFSLAPAPAAATGLKILLTSDHQLMPLTPVNLQKVVETIDRIDAVFLAGDLVNIPDRASEWFDDNRGGAFFPSLQGRASYKHSISGLYRGGEIIQNAPLFPAVGNHEVMGRFSTKTGLNDQYGDPYPRSKIPNAASLSPGELADRSFNTISVQELFNLPNSYYAVSFGDVRLVSLFACNIWRIPDRDPNRQGRYQERKADFNSPERWGYGQHIFEPIAKGSPQYNWLQAELKSPEFQKAKYKIVMFHHPPHTLGDNIVPAYTNPVQVIDRNSNEQIQDIRYEYPLDQDYLIRDIVPLLESAGVQLVFYGHSHLWNRFVSFKGMNFLESSNVGNTYGAYLSEKRRPVPQGFKEKYVATGDPNGLEPVMPSIAPLVENGTPQPYIASNDITVFSIFDTATGTVSSYRFDPAQPNSSVIKFDEFRLRT